MIKIKIIILVLAIIGVMSYVEGSQFPPANFINNCETKTVKMQEKKCTNCGIVKPVGEFHKAKGGKFGITSACGICVRNKSREYFLTKDGIITQIYCSQKQCSKRRKHDPPNYTKQELRDWCFSQEKFHGLYDDWKNSGFNKMLKPSCDRTDDYKGYSLSRLQLMTWEQNRLKAYADMKNGKNNKRSKAVVGTNKHTGEKVEFHSQHEASRKMGIKQGDISACCREKKRYSHAGGYVWRFKYS